MDTDKILLDHGSGGKIAHRLIARTLLPAFDNPILDRLDDGAVLEMGGSRLAFSTDTFVVDPIFFPGGDIGELAVNGTVNDIAMCGASPLYLSAGLIIEEGFPMSDLEKILQSMGNAARKAGVSVVTGDTKVVPKGAADRIFINTSGVGLIPDGVAISGANARPGDQVILSGTMADHGITILTQREGMRFDADVRSDTAPLSRLTGTLVDRFGSAVHVLRDPTRGGVGTTLNEIAESSGAGIRIYEEKLPVRDAVAGICELLGFDPLYVANEGKMLIIVRPDVADAVLETVRADEYGRAACCIGEVISDHPGRVFMQTRIGGTRIVDMLAGQQLPRIC
ncbi:hydrogenase expression/formation protein HypE [Desulfonema ishimotonii]|uniref:Hydrogenase expression/formation protein HypE n=1 Tax=Desulfonema ishimotonii TaxID=45657 RepID=A0A401G241_9BACT|nr:hydrogenase expression/formation protein HypE [Desulfonema ishimotonii]GBC63298.1 hydrogenase expression/formation protein HypE [Desulfonema ishimotonii]